MEFITPTYTPIFLVLPNNCARDQRGKMKLLRCVTHGETNTNTKATERFSAKYFCRIKAKEMKLQ